MIEIPVFVVCIFIALTSRLKRKEKPSLFFGGESIFNYAYYAKAMKLAGYKSVSFAYKVATINKRKDWDIVLQDFSNLIPIKITR